MRHSLISTHFASTSKRRSFAICLALLLALVSRGVLGQTPSGDQGKWSKDSVDISVDQNLNRSIHLKSPDGTVSVVISGIDLRVLRGSSLLATKAYGTASYDFGVNMIGELTWAPDSRSFFVTESDGGQLGFWFSTAYMVSDTSVTKVDISKSPLRAFQKSRLCSQEDLDNANAVGLEWIQPSSRILMAVLAPATTGCKKGVMGFEVDPRSGTVFSTYTRSQLKQKFPSAFSRLHY